MDPKPASSVDIGSVISKRLRAMKDLQENPDDVEAKERLESATADVRSLRSIVLHKLFLNSLSKISDERMG